MQYSILALAAAASLASAQSSSAAAATSSLIGQVIPVGQNCVPGGTACALGAQCYATNSMLQTICGNFQAACTSDQQCAFNTCNTQQGLCNGFIASSSATPTITSTPGGFTPAPSPTVTAPAGSLPLGAQCNPFVNPSQCAGGAECWASNSGIIARCGNFNAACTNNSQCSGTTCNNGLCNGFLPSSSSGASNATSSAAPSTLRSSSAGSSATGNVTRSASGSATRTGSATATTGLAQFTGAAVANAASGVLAVVLGAAAFAL